MTSLRYPGGRESNYYDFSKHQGYISWKGGHGQYNCHDGITTEEFLEFCEAVNCSTVFTTANVYKSGNQELEDNWIGPEVAQDWVRHLKDLGWSGQYWELGNELEYPDHTPDLFIEDYLYSIKEFSELMRQVDPTIKIGVCAVTPWQYQNGYPENFTLPILKRGGQYIDFVTPHIYPVVSWEKRFEVTDSLVREIFTWIYLTKDIEDLRSWLEEYIPDRRIEIMVTEWNLWSGRGSVNNLCQLVLGMDLLWDMILEGADGANIWNLAERPWYTVHPRDPSIKTVQALLMWYARNYIGNDILQCQTRVPTYEDSLSVADKTLHAPEKYLGLKEVPLVSAYATKSTKGDAVYLIVTNRDCFSHEIKVRIKGFSSSEYCLDTISGPDWNFSRLREPFTEFLSQGGNKLTIDLPARSLTVIEWRK